MFYSFLEKPFREIMHSNPVLIKYESILIAYMVVYIVLGTIFNVISFTIFYKYYNNYASALIFLSLSLVNLLSSLVIVPLDLARELQHFSNLLCPLSVFLRYFCDIEINILISLLAIERYLSINSITEHDEINLFNKINIKYNPKLVLILSVLVSALLAAISINFIHTNQNQRCEDNENILGFKISLVALFGINLCFLTYICVKLYIIVHKCRIRVAVPKNSSLLNTIQTEINSSDNFKAPNLGVASNLVSNFKQIRQDLDLARIFFAVILIRNYYIISLNEINNLYSI